MPNEKDCHVASMPANALDLLGLERMMQATGATSEANLIRAALWRLSEHLGLQLPLGTFALRSKVNNRNRSGKRKATTPSREVVVDQRSRGRGAQTTTWTHPWRQHSRYK